ELNPNETYHIHVLGAGYNLDPNLPALTQLENSTLTRLNEGIRIFRQLPNSILVTSAYSKYDLESQASVARKAAIELGVSPERIRMLETPSTTLEEAEAFQSKFGASTQVIIATDAMHMPRAMQIYRDLGYQPIAAPTNFKVHFGPKASNGLAWPNYHSFKLSNRVFRAQLKQLYYWAIN
ncbi:MAG: YdcF family protein, partial [Psychroflexus sp.]